jgi:hypothetical protein
VVVCETRQTPSETITCQFHSADCPASTMTVRRELRGMGFQGQAAAHKPNNSPVNAKRSGVKSDTTGQWTTGKCALG